MAGGVVVIDYGAGNLHSVHKALLASGLPASVAADPREAGEAAALVLPGQGHFGQVMGSFMESGFEPVVRRHIGSGRPFLGICVGLQLLCEGSEEAPGVPGLGLVPGVVRRFPQGHRVPQMGWNRLRPVGDSPLLSGVAEGAYVYYANSYYADLPIGEAAASGAVSEYAASGATSEYAGVTFAGAYSRGNLHATQFHPEKSQRVGLAILSNFARLVRGVTA